MSRLWYEQPAKEWEEAIPLGNGRMGAMVFGGITEERIQVNEESMWYGKKSNRINPDTKKFLPLIRELLANEEVERAEKMMRLTMSGCPDSMHPYQTLGDIEFTMEQEGTVSEYERSLDIDNAVYHMSYCMNRTVYEREIYLSQPDDCMIMRMIATGAEKLSFRLRLTRDKIYDGVKKIGADGICLYGNLGRGGYEFAMGLRARSTDGNVEVLGEHLVVEDATEVYLYFCADTTYKHEKKEKERYIEAYECDNEIMENCYDWSELTTMEQNELCMQQAFQLMIQDTLERKIQDAMNQSYGTTLKRHQADYHTLYGRVELELNETVTKDNLPTDKRIHRLKDGTSDIGLVKLYFDFSRYLLIACSREGGLPATLQGLWNKHLLPPWESKYTININTEMNYWMAETCNLPECHMPLLEMIKKIQKNGKKTASEMYGCRGVMCHHNTDIHGDTNIQDHWIPGSYWVMGAAWLCTHQWLHYEYTQDKEFLKEAFPLMREAALFFQDFLIDYNGYLVTSPSVSPENTYILSNEQRGSNSIGVTMDNQILRDLFTQCIKSAEILGMEDKQNDEIRSMLNRLIPTKISKQGTIMEWYKDYEEAEPGHRHMSHLYGLHPSGQITKDGTPDLAEASRRTLERRLKHGGGHTGWSRAWIINFYAKLWDGEKAYDNLQQLFANSTYDNLFDKHPPFQIDGNFGATAAITEMLVQSSSERIILLPALPKAWESGSVKGLRVKGNGHISFKWKHGELTECTLTALSNMKTIIKYKDETNEIQLQTGETYNIKSDRAGNTV